MDIQGLEIFSLWVEAVLSLLAVLLFLCAGWQIFQLAKFYANKKQKKSPRPLRILKKRKIISQFRFARIQQFQQISMRLIQDVNEFTQDSEQLSYEARTMLPLIAEARLLGEKLLSERKSVHKILNRKKEFQIEHIIHDLLLVENRLRAIPRAAYTLEDVVAGKFEHIASRPL